MVYTFPTLEEVLYFHEVQIALYGGSPGVRDLGLVESALFGAQQTFDGIDLYPNFHEKAAALWHGFVCNHAFVDGNKRIGLMVSHVFLLTNGYALEFTSQQAEMITMRLASSEMDRRELTTLIEGFIIPLRDQNHN
jgi:death-on-curing protein